MSQEIVFTSARHGLRTGSTGFCTVRSTRGMAGNLAQLLERLTGYSHVFDAYSNQANLNPVNFAHYIARLGDQKLHILARVSNAPLDHTNRSNKLAHLLAIDSSQLATSLSEGPAAECMKIPWVRDWSSDTEPYVLPDEKQIELPMLNQPKPGACDAWKEVTGDAGWAAVLASSAGETSDPMQVILPRDAGSRHETWALQLVQETLSLIPPARRWDVSYSTFFGGNLPVSINCRWQFILDGTDAAKRARLDPRARTIDIPGIAARKIPAPQLPLTPLTVAATRPWDNGQDDSIARRRTRVSPERSTPDRTGDLQHGEDAYVVTADKPAFAAGQKRRSSVPGGTDRRNRRRRPFLLHPASLLTLGIIVVVAIFLVVQQLQVKQTGGGAKIMAQSNEKSALQQQQKKKQKEQAQHKQRDEEAQERLKQEAKEQASLPASSGNTSKNVDVPDATMDTEPQPPEPPTSQEPVFSPLQDVRDLSNRLEIKVPRVGLDSGPDGPIHLAKIYVDSLDDFKLTKIIGAKSVLGPNHDLELKPRDNKEQPFRDWDVIRTGGNLGSPDIVGTFRLDESFDLTFKWHKDNRGFEIINCLLEMEAGGPNGKRDNEECTLREVSRVKPIQFDLNKVKVSEQLVSRNQLTNTDRLEMEYEFVNLPGDVKRKGPTVLRVGDSVEFKIKKTQNANYPRTAKMWVKLVEADLGFRIEIEMQLELPKLNPNTYEFEIHPVEFSPQLMNNMANDLKEIKSWIETKQMELERAQKLAARVHNDAPKNGDEKGNIREEYRKKMDRHDAEVERLKTILGRRNPEYDQLQLLAVDMNQMLAEISENGQLQFSLRLMIPGAGAEGIELVTTDGWVATE